MQKLRVGFIGCGKISDIYFKTLQQFRNIEISACSSLDIQESRAKADLYGIPLVSTPEELLQNPEIDCILNLTIPSSHSEITRLALEEGKHVYSEKPFVSQFKDGAELLELAKNKGLYLGNAPDTFLGGRWQTVRKLLDESVIGTPIGVNVCVGTHGVERHHPNPDFYYQLGGGPLLDLGPYYLTVMVFLFGSISRVSGISTRGFENRMIENGPRHGELIEVEVDTHSLSLLEFESGITGSMMISFDVWDSETPRLEIYGTDGVICIPDPDPVHGANVFGGPVWYRKKEDSRWPQIPRPEGREHWNVADNPYLYNTDTRGLGLVDMADAIFEQRPARANAALAYHVCEVMDGINNAPIRGEYQTVHTRVERPDSVPVDFLANKQKTMEDLNEY